MTGTAVGTWHVPHPLHPAALPGSAARDDQGLRRSARRCRSDRGGHGDARVHIHRCGDPAASGPLLSLLASRELAARRAMTDAVAAPAISDLTRFISIQIRKASPTL